MNKIFIEAKNEKTSECNFLKAILRRFFPDKKVGFVCIDGIGNLFNEANINQMRQAVEETDNVLILLDADTPEKGWGFEARKTNVLNQMAKHDIVSPFFLYPDNTSDGDVESLMEALVRKDLHEKWWDCFEDYEKCVGGVKDNNGLKCYNLPNRKARLHTFISSQMLSNEKRNKLGSGNWLFDEAEFWDLTRPALEPLTNFLRANLK